MTTCTFTQSPFFPHLRSWIMFFSNKLVPSQFSCSEVARPAGDDNRVLQPRHGGKCHPFSGKVAFLIKSPPSIYGLDGSIDFHTTSNLMFYVPLCNLCLFPERESWTCWRSCASSTRMGTTSTRLSSRKTNLARRPCSPQSRPRKTEMRSSSSC